jgi:hypothetical protein
MPPASSLVITGLISLSVRTRSPMTIASRSLDLKASQPPSASARGQATFIAGLFDIAA